MPLPHSGIKNRLLSVAAEEQAKRKTLFSLIIRHLKGFVKMIIKKCRKCGRRKAFYKSLGLCYCVSCYRRIYGEARD